MEFRSGSDMILILNLEDIKGKPLRVNDCDRFELFVWTANRNNFLKFTKRDLLTEGNVDRAAIPSEWMNTLETGVVCYTYSYAKFDSAFNHTDCMYDKVKVVTTDLMWRNQNFNQIPANPINYKTLEYLKDLIEEERVQREIAVGKIKNYVDGEYTNKLNDEIKRSNEVDIEIHKLIKSNKADGDAAHKELEDKLNAEVKRSNDVDVEIFNLIKGNNKDTDDKIDDITTNFNTALNTEIARATTKENEIATNLTTEINRVTAEINTTRDSVEAESNRAKAAEKLLTDTLNAETDRAIEKENALNSKVNELIENLGDEIERSLEKDREHKQELDIEVNRAKAEENRIDAALTVEVDRAKAKEDALNGAITSEVERAKTVEKDITDALKALKSSVADKNTEVTDALTAEVTRAKAAEKALTDSVDAEVARATAKEKVLEDALNAEITRSTDEDAAIKASIATINTDAAALSKKVDDEISRATAKENELKNSIDTVNTTVANVNSTLSTVSDKLDAEVTRSTNKDAELTKALSDEVARATTKENDLADGIAANATSINSINAALDVINGEGIGSINHAVEDSKHYTDDEIAKLKASTSTDLANTLKEYATKADVDGRIKDVIGTAPEALDTLGEIAEVLNGNGDAIDAINGVLAGKADKADTYTKADVDGKVATINSTIEAETSRATTAESTITTNLNTEIGRAKAEEARIEAKADTVATDVANEVTRAKAAEKVNADDIAAEVKRSTEADVEQAANILAETNRATNAEKVLSDKIDVLNGDASVIGSVAHAVEDAKHYTDDEVNKAKADAASKYQPKGSYLTEHQDISGLATKAEVTTETNRAKAAESALTDDIAALRTALKNSIKVENETLIITL